MEAEKREDQSELLNRSDDCLLRLRRVAFVLDRSVRSVRSLIQRRLLPAVQEGRGYRVKVGDLKRYIKKHTLGTQKGTRR